MTEEVLELLAPDPGAETGPEEAADEEASDQSQAPDLGENDTPSGAARHLPSQGEAAAARASFDLHAHYDALRRQGEELEREFSDFDLDAALKDPAFVRLTAPGIGVPPRQAWLALHPEKLERGAVARAAAVSRQALARAVSAGSLRPREGGGYSRAAPVRADYRSMNRSEQEALKDRIRAAAAQGRKLYP